MIILIFFTEHLECHNQGLDSTDAFEGAVNGRAGPCPPFFPHPSCNLALGRGWCPPGHPRSSWTREGLALCPTWEIHVR